MFFIPGLVYWWYVWGQTGVSPYRCVYGDPVCSLTVATYLLCGITAGAFIAAFNAARWALRTHNVAVDNLNLERSCILVERPITSEDEVPARTHYVHVMVVNGEIELRRPEARERGPEGPFESQIFEFDSIGRAAIVDAEISLAVTIKLATKPPTTKKLDMLVPIGSVAADGKVYVRVWAEKNTGDVVDIWWEPSGDQTRLTFRPQAQRPFVFVRYQQGLPPPAGGAQLPGAPAQGPGAQLQPEPQPAAATQAVPPPLLIAPQAPQQEATPSTDPSDQPALTESAPPPAPLVGALAESGFSDDTAESADITARATPPEEQSVAQGPTTKNTESGSDPPESAPPQPANERIDPAPAIEQPPLDPRDDKKADHHAPNGE